MNRGKNQGNKLYLTRGTGWVLTLALGLGLCAAGQALPSDRQQKITIQSDRAQLDERNGVTIYEGAVQMDQGTLRITADKLTVHSVNRKVSRIIAVGQPAHFQQQPALDQQLVTAEGNTIEYRVDQEELQLLENASLEQDGSTMSGDRIDYNIKDAIVVAIGDPTKTENQRIQIVIPPQTPPSESDDN
ncbi:lipopolysaccharide transport periplasmic protein LptA [Exilibacterium tricleocarpae]|uniref:Lipopolysaccharide export system protein LptA n=1 Tax=Exilibacterium tricleocarpae TaxID=2591008 RepID=A0A545TSI2_9GAMM|nr:lipopolysaccharide transport periplasmic protein LptA [Exilibacterium tricleocarpae]TQV80175.1 lipopolysaccharide transport periplasmic protein LptA [Exilibacterium tricleocarpae]